ncbi:hypothetical protein Mal15_04450 [Stieleria maiorica]|uniref:Uncharacterized protein n=1 Tax=Stieleria maiorica TaxID=2795974 RepID=A0A5B9MB61_9BACT|nr:hypothetical protein [Stieleria maiorica]QEF96417.1 hypothetical protein Mal15_04450 [Stieleria maiorica]
MDVPNTTPLAPSDDASSRTCEVTRGAGGHGVCPVCRGKTLIEIRGKLQCSRCHSICETCCEGGRG